MRCLALCAATALALAPVARAQTEASADQAALDRLKIEVEIAKLKAEQDKLRLEATKARIDALGLPKADGTTTLGEGAGKLEGWMLASRALEQAAAQIQRDVGRAAGGAVPIALLAADDRLDLTAGVVVPREMEAIALVLASVVKQHCRKDAKPDDGPAVAAAGASAAPAIIGAALSLLRTDTEITGFTVTGADAALLDAVASRPANGGNWVLPGEVADPPVDGKLIKAFDELLLVREAAALCRSGIAAGAGTEAEKKAAQPKLAALDAVLTRTDAFVARITAPREGGMSDLAAAAIADTLTSRFPNMLALRLNVSEAGGTLLKRSNLFTALGAPAVGITGGLVVSWRLFDPRTGGVKSGGILVCRTALTNLNAIHRGRAGAPSCNWTDPVAK